MGNVIDQTYLNATKELHSTNGSDSETEDHLRNAEISRFLQSAEKFRDEIQNLFEKYEGYYSESIYNLPLDLQIKDKDSAMEQDKTDRKLSKTLKCWKEEKLFTPILVLLKDFKTKFHDSYGNWYKQFQDYGEIYFDNEVDRLHLSMAYSPYANDDFGKLSPFGPWLVTNAELMEHQSIGVFDAMKDQYTEQNNGSVSSDKPNSITGLIKAQMILILIYRRFKEFCHLLTKQQQHELLKRDWIHPPLIQFSEGSTGAWASDREIPTIIHINQDDGTDETDFNRRVHAYAAVPHEIAHDIADTFNNDVIITQLALAIEDIPIPSYHKVVWQSWVLELFADAVGIGLLGNIAFNGLKKVMRKRLDQCEEPADMIISSDSHPNPFLRVVVAAEFVMQLQKERTFDVQHELDQWKNDYEGKFQANRKSDYWKNNFLFKDQMTEQILQIDRREIELIAECVLRSRLTCFPEKMNVLELIRFLQDDNDIKYLMHNFDHLIENGSTK